MKTYNPLVEHPDRDYPESRDYAGSCHTCGGQFFGTKAQIQTRLCRQCKEAQPQPDPSPAQREPAIWTNRQMSDVLAILREMTNSSNRAQELAITMAAREEVAFSLLLKYIPADVLQREFADGMKAQPLATAGEPEGARTIDEVCGKPPGTFHAMREAGMLTEEASLHATLDAVSPAPASAEREGIRRPTLLTSCAICAEDYSWPLDEVFWCALTAVWICRECWNESHGYKGPTAKVIVDSDHQLARAQDLERFESEQVRLCHHMLDMREELDSLKAERAQYKTQIARLTSLVEDAFNEAWRTAYKTGLSAGHPLAGHCDDEKEREQDWTDSDAAAELNRNTEKEIE